MISNKEYTLFDIILVFVIVSGKMAGYNFSSVVSLFLSTKTGYRYDYIRQQLGRFSQIWLRVCVSGGGGGEGVYKKLFEQVRDLYLYVHISSET